MAYSEKVVDHYENPRNVGAFDAGDNSVGTQMSARWCPRKSPVRPLHA